MKTNELVVCSITAVVWDIFIWSGAVYLIVNHNWNTGTMLFPIFLSVSPGAVYRNFFRNE